MFFYPTESLAHQPGKDYKAVHLRNGFLTPDNLSYEIALTDSQKAWEVGTMVCDENNKTFLPLSEAFLIIPEDKFEASVNELKANGYSEEWIIKHTYCLPLQRYQRRSYSYDNRSNDIADKLISHEEKINTWLESNRQPPKESVVYRLVPMDVLEKDPEFVSNGDLYMMTLLNDTLKQLPG